MRVSIEFDVTGSNLTEINDKTRERLKLFVDSSDNIIEESDVEMHVVETSQSEYIAKVHARIRSTK
jgi:hypothetical protein